MVTSPARPTRPKRILIIGINYVPETTGIAPYTAGMAEALAADGFDVEVLTTPPHYPAWEITPGWKKWTNKRTHKGVAVRHLRHYVPAHPTGKSRIVSELSFALRVLFTHKREPDLVIAITPALLSVHAAALIARKHRAPLGVVTQDLYTYAMGEIGLLGGKGAKAVESIEGFALRQATGIAAIHDRFAEAINNRFQISLDRIEVIRNWTHIEAPRGDRADVRKRMGWADDEIIALHAGNMGAKQGLENVVEAARAADQDPNNKVRFVLMGQGNRRKELEELAIDIRSIDIVDPVDENEFSDTLGSSDVLVLNETPGIAEMCVPSKLTSYFATGRPVVGASNARSAAATEIVASGAGTVVAPGDSRSLLTAVHEMAGAEGSAKGANGPTFAKEQLSEQKSLAAYVSWAHSLLK